MNGRLFTPGGSWPLVLTLALAVHLSGAAGEGTAAPDSAPDLDALLRRAVENARADREMEARFRARYAYVRTKVTDTWNAKGELKKREYNRHVHHPAQPEPDPWAGGQTDAHPAERSRRAYERRDVPVSTNLLERFHFSLVGREEAAGRPAWVVDFAPAAERLPAASLIEKFINRMAGRVWIDVADQSVSRAQFHLTDPVNVVGGLVGALKQCDVYFERTRTEDGLWYTQLLTWRIEGRQLWSLRIMTRRETLTDVHRVFPASTAGPEEAVETPEGSRQSPTANNTPE